MEKKAGKKTIIIIVVAVAVVLVTAIVLIFVNKKEAYRLLKVFEVDGDANVSRESMGDIVPYSNMVLESGDRVSLNTGKMTLQADEDKYIYLEEQTELVLKASGDSKNSKTTIELEKGAITNDVQKKLSDDSSYEINTPNSTMSVRGTVFRVWIYEIDGVKYTRVSVFDGTVVTRLVFKDGTVDTKEVRVGKGKEVIIYEDDTTTNYLSDPTDIDYDTLPDDVLELLVEVNDDGTEVSITNPEIKKILEGPYTVTFMYNGSVFGTQTVSKGDKATEPTLKPEDSGSWNFDFNKPITRNMKIEWK